MIRLPADDDGVARAASIVRGGGVVVWPSGGVYGLAASALSPEAVRRIYRMKRRPPGKPLQVITSPEQAGVLGRLPRGARRWIRDMWPGYVGFVVRRKAPELESLAGPDDTVLLVCPNRVARVLSLGAQVPVVGTSANLSGRPEILTAEEAERSFVESVDALVDGGPQSGELNTLLDVSRRPYRVLRSGAVPASVVLTKLAETTRA